MTATNLLNPAIWLASITRRPDRDARDVTPPPSPSGFVTADAARRQELASGRPAREAPTDVELADAARNGDRHAFGQLVDRHAAALFRLALSVSGSRSDAEDVCQETFVGAFRGIARFEGRSSVKTWLTRILLRRAAKHWNRDHWRRRTLSMHPRNDPRDFESGGNDELGVSAIGKAGGAEQVEQKLDVREAIRALPPAFRDVILLREIEGMSYQEIADVLGVPRGTVESRLHRARAKLQEALHDYGNAPSSREH